MTLLVLKYFFVKSIAFVAKEVIEGAEHSKRLDVWTSNLAEPLKGSC